MRSYQRAFRTCPRLPSLACRCDAFTWTDNTLASCTGVAPVLAALAPTLECVHLGSARMVDSQTLALIAAECTHVKELNVSWEAMSANAILSAFGSTYFPLLERLTILNVDLNAIDDAVATAIFQHHPLLTTFVSEWSRISPTTCADIVSNSPHLTEFMSAVFEYEIFADKSDKQCRVALWELGGPYTSDVYRESMLQLSSSRTHPLAHFECGDYDAVLNNEDLITVVSALGADFKTVSVALNVSNDDDNIVQQITLLCPLLEVLCLAHCDFLTDASLRAIASNCRFITQLSLNQGGWISDFGICRLLGKIGEQLQELHLLSCATLTSSTLFAILSLCPNLKILESYFTAIPVESFQADLIVADRLPLLKTLKVDPDIFAVLKHFVTNPANAVDQKWTNVLEEADY